MALDWNRELEERVYDLRVHHGFKWEKVQEILGFLTPDQARIRFSRMKGEGRLPTYIVPGTFTYVGLTPEPELPEPELEYELTAGFTPYDYTFDGTNFHFPVNGKMVSIPQKTWEDIVAKYSTQGGNATMYQVAASIGMHKKVLEACLRAYGHFKARPPVTREALGHAESTGASKEPLYHKAIEVSEARFSNQLDARRLANLERLAREYQELKDQRAVTQADVQALVADLKASGFGAPVRTTVPELPKAPSHWHWAVFDLHLGLETRPENGQWGHAYTTDLAIGMLQEQAARIAQRLAAHPVGVLHLSFGGDLFHAFLGMTERGTLLKGDTEDRVVFRKALAMVRNIVATLTETGTRLIIRSIPGNHDHLFAELFLEVVAVAFEKDPLVVVENSLKRRGAFLVGSTLHVLDHGKGFESFGLKAQASAELMMREVAGPDFFRTKQAVVYVGHTHHAELKQVAPHLEFQRVPTIASSSKYEEGLMLHSTAMGQLYKLDQEGRIEETCRLYLQVA